MSTEDRSLGQDRDGRRQRVVRVPGARRAKLTPAPDTSAEPDAQREDAGSADQARGWANDERLRRDVPPHY